MTLYCVMSTLHRAEAAFLLQLQQCQQRDPVSIPGMEEEHTFPTKMKA